MKRLLLLACVAALAACSSSSSSNVKLLQPDVDMIQLNGPADQNFPAGEIEVQFALRIANKSGETIKLKQVEMFPVGLGGPYEIRRKTYFFNQDVAPNASKDVSFWARAVAEGDAYAGDANAPVSLRAVAVFETADGSFRKILSKTFNQRGRGAVGSQ